jgi:hypothetical protein
MPLDFHPALELSHLALGEFVTGNPEPLKELYSHREDVSLANPFGPPVSGWKAAAETMERAARIYSDLLFTWAMIATEMYWPATT